MEQDEKKVVEGVTARITSRLFAELQKQAEDPESIGHICWTGDWGNLHHAVAKACAEEALVARITELESLLADLAMGLAVSLDTAEEIHKLRDDGMKPGKLLMALIDPSLKYRLEITAMHEARAKANQWLNDKTRAAALSTKLEAQQ